MGTKRQMAIEQREYMKDLKPQLAPSEFYEAPHFVQIVLPRSESFTTLAELSRDQVKSLIPLLQQWLVDYPDQDVAPRKGAEEKPSFLPKTANELDDSDIGRQIRFNYRSENGNGFLGEMGPLGTATATLLGFERGINHMTLTLESIGDIRKVTPKEVPLNTIIISYPHQRVHE